MRFFKDVSWPRSRTNVLALFVIMFIYGWNQYLWPLLVGTNENSRVLTVALGVFRSQTPQTGPDWAGLMAAVLVAALPLLIIFVLFAKRIVNSIGFSAGK